MSGKLIVIEGADGAGKATQSKLLAERLKAEGMQIEGLEFPRYEETFFGSYIREWIDEVHGNFIDLDPRLASILFAGDRFEVREKITGWLNEGKHVILDRYVSASMLHQGAKFSDNEKRGAFLLWLAKLEYEVFKLPRPDLVVYLDMPAEMRHALLTTDESKPNLGHTETDAVYQAAVQNSAVQVAGLEEWKIVSCLHEDKLRSKDDINAELYGIVRPLLN
ncbi:thymidylate kinase [Candidatus Nomurabacteria bacterium]|nr:thymidylate kinase [Candidatus Kaiserbacteria bacterium]MCB9810369.1 thymidylate kinase [Candidatus Nomurabacteria bacterium]MCB9818049.1 thymidylate kinase [Candidatus Nomurabacteria bacterium]